MANLSNRVLIRAGARILTEQEVEKVHAAGLTTDTVCTFLPPSFTDGDPGEC